MRIPVLFQKLTEDATVPSYAHGPEEDAGMDLTSTHCVILQPGKPQAVGTGLAVELPSGYEGQIRPRSGLALKGVTVANAPGTIDPSYRGEIKVLLINQRQDGEVMEVLKGDRIAQLVIAPYVRAEVQVVSQLSDSDRGTGGFGSSGR